METLEIKKGWYWSAGSKFKWTVGGYDKAGVGIDCRLLAQNAQLRVIVDGISYLLDCEEAKAFVRRFMAFENHQGIKLGVVSKSLFKTFLVETK